MRAPLRVLILEDRAADAELMLHELRRAGYEPDWQRVETEPDYLVSLEPALDIILADYSLPQFDALRALHLLQERDLDIPFVVVTGSISEEAAVECMKQGAADYLLKDRLGRLGPAVEHALRETKMRTEKRRAEEALRVSEERYRALYRDNPSMFFTLNTDGKVVSVNEFGASQLGYTIDELEGQSVLKVFYEADQPAVTEQLKTCLQNPWQVYRWQFRKVRKDGSLLWVEELARAVSGPGGVLNVLVVCDDITERKWAEEALRRYADEQAALYKTSLRLNAQLEISDLLHLIVEQAVTLLGAETGCLYSYDSQRDELSVSMGVGYFEKFLGKRIKPGEGLAGRVFASRGSMFVKDYSTWSGRAAIYDGESRFKAILAVPLAGRKSVLGVLDIGGGERKQTFDERDVRLAELFAAQAAVALENARLHEELQRRARELAALNKAGQIMVSTLDLDTLLGLVMEQVRRLLDVEAASVLMCIPPPEDRRDVPQKNEDTELVFAAATGPGREKLVGTRLAGAAGIAGWVVRARQPALVSDAQSDPRFDSRVDALTGMTTCSLLAVPLVSKGKVLGVVEVVNKSGGIFDEHDLQVLEALSSSGAIAIENARLYATELQRAALLARALEQRHELNRLQREFIQNVSHELRTPLSLIRGHAEILESGWLGDLRPDQRTSINVITRRAQTLGKLVDDIVSVLEIEQQELKRESVDLAQLVQMSLADFQASAKEIGLALTAEIAPDLPPTFGDAMALRRALENLVGNALKFTPAGGRVTVRLSRDKANIVLEVTDTGVGIPSDQLGRIFERFYQVDGSMTRRYGGVGLGLALVKEIVEAHSGQVTVASQVGVGTTFTIVLPLNETSV